MAKRKQYAVNNEVVSVINDWLEEKPDFGLTSIAEQIGITKSASCFMTQIRSGRSKFPITKVVRFAEVMGQDPQPLMKAILNEYYPELRDALIESNLLCWDDRTAENASTQKKAEKMAV